jgi:hypothetical protein
MQIISWVTLSTTRWSNITIKLRAAWPEGMDGWRVAIVAVSGRPAEQQTGSTCVLVAVRSRRIASALLQYQRSISTNALLFPDFDGVPHLKLLFICQVHTTGREYTTSYWILLGEETEYRHRAVSAPVTYFVGLGFVSHRFSSFLNMCWNSNVV